MLNGFPICCINDKWEKHQNQNSSSVNKNQWILTNLNDLDPDFDHFLCADPGSGPASKLNGS